MPAGRISVATSVLALALDARQLEAVAVDCGERVEEPPPPHALVDRAAAATRAMTINEYDLNEVNRRRSPLGGAFLKLTGVS